MIKSREELIEYCLRKLGKPVIKINLDINQIEDAINDTMDLFWDYHVDGTNLTYLAHVLTADDIALRKADVGADVVSVLRVLPINFQRVAANLEYQMFITQVMDIRRSVTTGMNNFVLNSSYMSTVENLFASEKTITFNKYKRQIVMPAGYHNLIEGDLIVIECYTKTNPDDYPEVYNDDWIKRYATALMKKQWGQNLIKFQNATLPGGIQINAEEIYQEGVRETTELLEALKHDYQAPVDMSWG